MLTHTLMIAAALGTPQGDSVPLYTDLGSHHHAISTTVPAAQAYFDQGLRLVYGFNHAEAIRSFRAAQRLDPSCAMCWWGEALAFGPNLNAAMDSASAVAARVAIREALARLDGATAKERAYVRALAERYGTEPVAARAFRDTAYARAMDGVARRYPADDDARVLAADAHMNLSPWDYYREGKRPKPNAAAALAHLETVLARNADHAGACHFFIHAVEAAHPERAVPCAERLPSLMPGAGHIVHMPAHVYIRVGRYADAIDRNVHAVHADEEHIADMAPDGVYRLAYYPHNYHFLWFAATMAGRAELAIESARHTAAKTNRDLMREPDLAALQHYVVTPLFALVRFGRWEETLAEPAPPNDLPYMTGIWHYARAVALAALGRFDAAESELAGLRAAAASPALEGTIWGFNSVASVLHVAIEAAAGDLAYRSGDLDRAIVHYRRGVDLEDAMTYDEPPTWHLPVRHQLGAALLAAGAVAQAERVYREDLERHPENGWSLTGLAAALAALDRHQEAEAVTQRRASAWRGADVTLTSSRF